jgi:hypothetical protein
VTVGHAPVLGYQRTVEAECIGFDGNDKVQQAPLQPWLDKNLILGWKVTKGFEPHHWDQSNARPGDHTSMTLFEWFQKRSLIIRSSSPNQDRGSLFFWAG